MPKDEYSLRRFILSKCDNSFRGPENDIADELLKHSAEKPLGRLVPWRAFRDLNVTTASQGGDFVSSEVTKEIIPLLRNRTCVLRAGATVLGGLVGNTAIPRQTSAATASSLTEQASVTASTQAVEQVTLTPHRISAQTKYGRQLLLQSSPDVDRFLQNDLMEVVGLRIDKLALEGAGANSEPTGIVNVPGINTVTFGAAADWAHVISFETALATANADAGRMAYVTTPSVKGKWKSAVKVTNQASFLWENAIALAGSAPDYGVGSASDGVVNGYRAMATNQVSNNLVYFANWQDVILGFWGSPDIIVDPYTLAASATIIVTINLFFDVAVRHAKSITISTDSGAQ